MIQPACPVRGHQHAVLLVRRLVQQGSGQQSTLLECPSEQYRWLVVESHQLTQDTPKMGRPRFGWRKP